MALKHGIPTTPEILKANSVNIFLSTLASYSGFYGLQLNNDHKSDYRQSTPGEKWKFEVVSDLTGLKNSKYVVITKGLNTESPWYPVTKEFLNYHNAPTNTRFFVPSDGTPGGNTRTVR